MARKKFSSRRKVRKKSIFLRKWFLAFAVVCLVGLAVAYAGYTIVTEPYRERAETYDMSQVNAVELPNLIFDRENREIGRMFTDNRSPVSFEEIPDSMVDALVSGEDSRFFEHNGVDYMGIARATILNLKSGNQDSGASTLTMQLARNAYNLKAEARKRDESGYERKLVEIFLAQRIEKHYTKSEILEFYINRVAFGSGFFGVRSASLGYFGKEPKDLSVQECASLVGCIKNPSTFSPLRSKKNNKKSRDNVLRRMAIEGAITEAERDRLQGLPIELNPKPIQRNTSHLYDRIAATVRQHVPAEKLEKGNFRVFTSIDRDIQQLLDETLREQLDSVEQQPGYQHPVYAGHKARSRQKPKYLQGAALMLDNTTGEVLGYVGGRDFSHSQYDFIEAGRKPLGTAFFPMIYAAALEAGSTLSSVVIDEAMDNRLVMIDGVEGILGEWGAEVDQPSYQGEILLKQALAHSKVAATVRLGKQVGLEKVRQMAKRFGFKVPTTKALTRELVGTESVSLSELVRAYAVFANGGKKAPEMRWVTRIESGDGAVVYSAQAEAGKKEAVLHPATSFLTHAMLEEALKTGSGQRGFEAEAFGNFSGGAKTGTTSDFADNWFVGYNSGVSCGVWTGFWDGSRKEIYPGAFSVDTVMPVWSAAMQLYQNKYQPAAIAQPKDVVLLDICRHSGQRLTSECEEYERDPKTGKMRTVSTGTQEYFYKGNQPTRYCDLHGSSSAEIGATAVNLNQRINAKEFAHVQPVQPVAPTLLGEDPYGSVQPAFVPRDASVVSSDRGLQAIDPDQMLTQDIESTITMEKPERIRIFAD